MNRKKLFIGIGAAAAVVVVAVIAFFMIRAGRGYRDITVFDISGTVKAVREGKTLSVAKNMKLKSGDEVRVGGGGFLRLKLDEDKYVFADEDTTIILEATGSAKTSRTAIYVAKGSVITEVQKKLEGDSSFDIVTPNTTMAIRGTLISASVKEVQGNRLTVDLKYGQVESREADNIARKLEVNSGKELSREREEVNLEMRSGSDKKTEETVAGMVSSDKTAVETQMYFLEGHGTITAYTEKGAVVSEAGEGEGLTYLTEVEGTFEDAVNAFVNDAQNVISEGENATGAMAEAKKASYEMKEGEKTVSTEELASRIGDELGGAASSQVDIESIQSFTDKIQDNIESDDLSDRFNGAVSVLEVAAEKQIEERTAIEEASQSISREDESGSTPDGDTAADANEAGSDGDDLSGSDEAAGTEGDTDNTENVPDAEGGVEGAGGDDPQAQDNAGATDSNAGNNTGYIANNGYTGGGTGNTGNNTADTGSSVTVENRNDESSGNSTVSNGEGSDAQGESEEERLAREESERLEKEEEERLEKEEAEKKEREEAEKTEKERLEKEEAEKLEKEEQEKKDKEEAERLEKEEKERLEKEEAEKAEKERLEKEEAEKAEKERLEKEEAEKAEKERLEKEEAEKAEKERLEREAAEKAEKERLEREEAEKAAQQEAQSGGTGSNTSDTGSSGYSGGGGGGGSTVVSEEQEHSANTGSVGGRITLTGLDLESYTRVLSQMTDAHSASNVTAGGSNTIIFNYDGSNSHLPTGIERTNNGVTERLTSWTNSSTGTVCYDASGISGDVTLRANWTPVTEIVEEPVGVSLVILLDLSGLNDNEGVIGKISSYFENDCAYNSTTKIMSCTVTVDDGFDLPYGREYAIDYTDDNGGNHQKIITDWTITRTSLDGINIEEEEQLLNYLAQGTYTGVEVTFRPEYEEGHLMSIVFDIPTGLDGSISNDNSDFSSLTSGVYYCYGYEDLDGETLRLPSFSYSETGDFYTETDESTIPVFYRKVGWSYTNSDGIDALESAETITYSDYLDCIRDTHTDHLILRPGQKMSGNVATVFYDPVPGASCGYNGYYVLLYGRTDGEPYSLHETIADHYSYAIVGRTVSEGINTAQVSYDEADNLYDILCCIERNYGTGAFIVNPLIFDVDVIGSTNTIIPQTQNFDLDYGYHYKINKVCDSVSLMNLDAGGALILPGYDEYNATVTGGSIYINYSFSNYPAFSADLYIKYQNSATDSPQTVKIGTLSKGSGHNSYSYTAVPVTDSQPFTSRCDTGDLVRIQVEGSMINNDYRRIWAAIFKCPAPTQ